MNQLRTVFEVSIDFLPKLKKWKKLLQENKMTISNALIPLIEQHLKSLENTK